MPSHPVPPPFPPAATEGAPPAWRQVALPATAPERPRYLQATIDDIGTPLAEVTFVVVDLETTGGSPNDGAITEIGAVKVRGGQVLGEFQTLVDPGREIPPYISELTGITSMMVAAAPRIDSVLPAFLEFARGTVLVAHNAPFDLGFLRAACAETGTPWPAFASVDTAGWPAGCSPATRCPTASSAPSHPSSRPRRRPATGPWTMPGPPSTCCTGCSNGSARWASPRWRS